MKESKRKRLQRMEYEDAAGIKRRAYTRCVFTSKTLSILRIFLIAAVPIVYFLCSPLLFAVVFLWFLLLFAVHSAEKRYNDGLKSDLRTKFPKTDCILCLVLIAVVAIGVTVSSVSVNTRSGFFDGMTEEEIGERLDGVFDSGDFVLRRIESVFKDVGSLMTGTRWLFRSERGFGDFGGFGGAKPPDGISPPSGGMPDMSEMLSDMPFSMVFGSVVKAVSTGMLVVVCIVGVVCSVRTWKLGDAGPTEKELLKRRKKEEERARKRNEKRNFFSVKKTDFSEVEKELLSDLDFLFDAEEECGGKEEKTMEDGSV